MKLNRIVRHRWLFAAVAILMLSVGAMAWPHKKTVELKDANGASVGKATIKEAKKGVRVELKVKNLPPGLHAIHFHQKAVCTPPDFKSSGGHFNPYGKHHGLHNPEGAHAGDMYNFSVSGDGTSRAKIKNEQVTLKPGVPNSLLSDGGTALVIHAGADDMRSDPAGNAGPRIACGVITP
jgi:Cu-Zn family superoxide dismutase